MDHYLVSPALGGRTLTTNDSTRNLRVATDTNISNQTLKEPFAGKVPPAKTSVSQADSDYPYQGCLPTKARTGDIHDGHLSVFHASV